MLNAPDHTLESTSILNTDSWVESEQNTKALKKLRNTYNFDQIRLCINDLIRRQQASIKKIDCRLMMFNVLMFLLISIDCVFYVKTDENYDYQIYYLSLTPILLIFCFFVLFYSVFRMRKTIKSIKFAFPNEKLMIIHFVNFPIWLVIISLESFLTIIVLNMNGKVANNDEISETMLKLTKIMFLERVMASIQTFFCFWMGFFVLFLIFK